MEYYIFIVLCLCSRVLANDCVTFNFEDGFDHNECGFIANDWILHNYTPEDVIPFHNKSTTYISPEMAVSCTVFVVTMENGGKLNINVYLRLTAPTEFLQVQIWGENNNLIDSWMSDDSYNEVDWSIIPMSLDGASEDPTNYNIQFTSMVSESSILMVDSILYTPPNFDGECNVYDSEDIYVITTTEAEPTDSSISTDYSDPTDPSVSTDLTSTSYATESSILPESTGSSYPTESSTSTEYTDSSYATESSISTDSSDTTDSSYATEPSISTDSGDSTTQYDTDDTTDEGTDAYEDVTMSPITEEEEDSAFWKILTITLVAIGISIFIIAVSYISYRLGKRKVKTDTPDILYEDLNNLPKTIVVPRVKSIYSENPYSKNFL